MQLFTASRLEPVDHQVLEMIDQLRHRLRYHVVEPRRWSGLLRRVMLARAIRGSNTIEGFTVSLDDAFAALDAEEPLEAGAAAWAAVVGYRNAMTYVLQLVKADTLHISTDTLKALHFMMQSYDLSKWPGRWRASDIFVVDEDADVTVYTGPDYDDIDVLMNALGDSLNDPDPTQPPMVLAA